MRGLEVVRAGAGAAGGRDGECLQVQSAVVTINTGKDAFCSEYLVCANLGRTVAHTVIELSSLL